MGITSNTVTILACIVFLTIHSENVYALRGINLAVKWSEEKPFSRGSSFQGTIAPTPSIMFDPNISSKRRVRRGSDPIHNKC
ncbi:hypothetical protein SSX86_013868 [Deinandra increscens subsp. villosa]|uniref:Uncharacterized protein n=1 Tax=Deinandra increscens subsp. villosa TaxID=3103831 RepID=A0AAP0D5H1_9ASTR